MQSRLQSWWVRCGTAIQVYLSRNDTTDVNPITCVLLVGKICFFLQELEVTRLNNFSCKIGEEAVTWLVEKLKLSSREEAVAIGEVLMYRGIIHQVTEAGPFTDGKTFYRFTKVTTPHRTTLHTTSHHTTPPHSHHITPQSPAPLHTTFAPHHTRPHHITRTPYHSTTQHRTPQHITIPRLLSFLTKSIKGR